MTKLLRCVFSLGLFVPLLAQATNTAYILSSSVPEIDNAAKAVFEANGFSATIGQSWSGFDGSDVILDYDVVYLQPNANWVGGMSPQSQQVILDYVSSGGGIMTCEWAAWLAATGSLPVLKELLPVVPTGSYGFSPTGSFSMVSIDPAFTTGLPANFTVPLDSFAGTASNENVLAVGAKKICGFYDGSYIGLSVLNYASGRVASFCTTNGINQLQDPNFAKLFGNAAKWAALAAPGPGCKGAISTPDYDNAGNPVQKVRVSYRLPGTNNVVWGSNINVDATGKFTCAGPLTPGTYDIVVKGSHWLSKKRSVNTSIANADAGVFTLVNGDVDNDNIVTIVDYSILSNTFDLAQGETGYDARADLDGDRFITIVDYSILSDSFDMSGE